MKITAIIMDWAGTTVDFGSFAPVDAFMTAFEGVGLYPTADETRAPMGIAKRTHIAVMLGEERLAGEWIKIHGKPHTEEDIDKIYEASQPALFQVLEKYATPIPGVLETIARLREMGIRIGSTTGYTREMMDVVAPIAKSHGYEPDCLITPEEAGGMGRPFPHMLWRNLEILNVSSISQVLKVGDTAADMEEGKAAGCLSVGIIWGSSMLGLTEGECMNLSSEVREELFCKTREQYFAAGADFVLDCMLELPTLIRIIGGTGI